MQSSKNIYRPDSEMKQILITLIQKYQVIIEKMEKMEHLLKKLNDLTNELNDLRLSFDSLDSELTEIRNKIQGSEDIAS